MRWFCLWPLLVVLAGCRHAAPLPVFWQVPPFQLTSQTGEAFDSKALAGHVWVADFIYTSCPGPCPRMSSMMRGVQAAVAGLADVRLLSFTVDPKTDSPGVLAGYAAKYKAVPGRWFFLTGSTESLENICRNGFKLGDVDGSLAHSTRFVLVDRRGMVRGFYSISEDGAVPRLVRDIRVLEQAG